MIRETFKFLSGILVLLIMLWVIVGVAGMTMTMVSNSIVRFADYINLPALVAEISDGGAIPSK